METMRESWTDGRLDDLGDRIDRGFEHATADRQAIRAEMVWGFEQATADRQAIRSEMGRGFEQAAADRQAIRAEMGRGFEQAAAERRELRVEGREHHAAMERRFDSLQQTMILAAAGVIAALIGLIATQL